MAQTEYLAADDSGLDRAAELLRGGHCVAFPTETVYGLGADASNAEAVARIYAAKDRPSFNPLIAHFPSREAAMRQGFFNGDARALATAFWPGPLTLVVPVCAGTAVCDLARAGLPSVGLRVPDHPLALRILERAGVPIAAPSANSSGHVSATSAPHVLKDLAGRIAAVLDGGDADVGVESTIVDCTGAEPRLLRPGGIARDRIEKVLGKRLERSAPVADKPLAPGMLTSHYAPKTRVRLDARAIGEGEAALLFGSDEPAGLENAVTMANLSPRGDLGEAAARLFSALRLLDDAGAAAIAVAPVPRAGLGEAINDRLARAAAQRET